MTRRVLITLHVDAFNMAQGGAFTVYDEEGRKVGVVVLPGFIGGEMTVPDAAKHLAHTYEGWWNAMPGQLAFPVDERPQAPTT